MSKVNPLEVTELQYLVYRSGRLSRTLLARELCLGVRVGKLDTGSTKPPPPPPLPLEVVMRSPSMFLTEFRIVSSIPCVLSLASTVGAASRPCFVFDLVFAAGADSGQTLMTKTLIKLL